MSRGLETEMKVGEWQSFHAGAITKVRFSWTERVAILFFGACTITFVNDGPVLPSKASPVVSVPEDAPEDHG